MTHTDSAGNFSLDTYEGTEYLLQFDIDKPTGEVTVEVLFSSECFVLSKNSGNKPLRISLKKGNVECDEEKLGF